MIAMARIHGVDNRPGTWGVRESQNTCLGSFIPPLEMIYQDHNFVLWQVLFFNAWVVCGFSSYKIAVNHF